MISVKTINNQNAVINSVLGLDGNSNTIVNGRLTIQDTSGSLVITPSGIIAPTNTVLNNLTVNGTSNFNDNVNISTYNFDITNSAKNQGMRISNNGANNGTTDIEGLGVSTRFNFYSTPSTGPRVNNFSISNGNTCTLQAQAGQGIQMTNNQIAINGISTFNAGSTFKSTSIVSGTDFRVMDTGNNQGIQIFASNDLGNNTTALQGIGANSRFQINTRDATNQFRNLFLEYGNHSQLSTATCGIDCLNDTVLLFSSTTTPTISIAPTYPDNTTKIATTSFVSSAITSINPAITYPPTNSNTLNINNTISLTDGTTTNTLNQSDWTGTIKTVNTAADVTHFLNFSDSSGTGQGHPQKNSNLSCNPFLSKITATTFEGTATISDTINLSSDDTSGTYFLPFSKTINTTSGNKLFIDNVTGPLSYDPSTSTLTSAIFNGSATTVTISDDNTATTFYPTFTTATGTGRSLFVDSVTGPLTYEPSAGRLTAGQIRCDSLNPLSSVSNSTVYLGITTGSISIMPSQTTGAVNIGNAAATTGLVNIRPPLVLARQLQTTNSTTYPPNAVNHLGFTVQTLGSSFTTTSISANTNTNLFSYSFTSANYGTYSFSAIVALSPNDNTASRQLILAISQSSATVVFTPFLDMKYSTANVGYPYLNVQGVIQIYSGSPTIYLVAYCLGSAASVQTSNTTSHFSYTRIA